jgi:hypothetical protein
MSKRRDPATRRPCLEIARQKFGPFTKFVRRADGTYAVTIKLPGKHNDHVTLGESKDGWMAAIRDAERVKAEAKKTAETLPPIVTAEELETALADRPRTP